MEPDSEPDSFEVLVPSANNETSEVTAMDPGTNEESHHELDATQNLQPQQTDKLLNLVNKKLSSFFRTFDREKSAMKKQIEEAVDAVMTSVKENAQKDHPENFDKHGFFTRMQDEIKSGIQRSLKKCTVILGLSMLLLILAMSGIYFFVNIHYAGIHNYPIHLANEMSALAENIKRANSIVEEVQMAMTSKGMTNKNEANGVIIGFQEEMTEMKGSIKKLSVDVKELEEIMKPVITNGLKPSDDLIKFQMEMAEIKASVGKLSVDMKGIEGMMKTVFTSDGLKPSDDLIKFQREMAEIKASVGKLSVDMKEMEGMMKTISGGIKSLEDLKFQTHTAEIKESISKLPIYTVTDLMNQVKKCDTKTAQTVELKVDTLLKELENVKSELKISDDMLGQKIHHSSDKHSSLVTVSTALLGAVIFLIIVPFLYSRLSYWAAPASNPNRSLR